MTSVTAAANAGAKAPFVRPKVGPRPVSPLAHEYGEEAFWVKGREAVLARLRRLTVIIRQGDRTDEAQMPKQFVRVGVPIPVFYLDAIAATGGRLGFEPDDGTTVEVVRQKVIKLGDIRDEDLWFEMGSAVPNTASQVRDYLEQELAPGKKYDREQVLTLSYLRYLPDAC